MSRLEGPVVRFYQRLARLLLGGELGPERTFEMTAVFAQLWRELDGRPLARAALLAREGSGLWDARRQFRLRRVRSEHQTHWTRRDRMGEVWGDFRVGLRVLFRSPVATLAAVVTLALGIGGTTAVYSVADGVLFNPMNFPDADALVLVLEESREGDLGLTSLQNFQDVQTQTRTLESFALYRPNSVAVTGLGEPERIRGEFVSASYFDVLRGQPVLGRAIAAGEDVPGGDRTAVLAHRYWVRRFASDPGVIGQVVNLNNEPHTIVGVMPEGFRSYWDDTEAWISLHTAPGSLTRGARGFFAIGRLADGVALETADRELDEIMTRLAEAHPDENTGRSAHTRPLTTWVVGDQRRTLVWSLLGAIGLVLLIATANVANLQLARAAARTREMAIRSALGGNRGRLLTQLLVENVTLAALGGALGIGVAALTLRLLLSPGFSPFDMFDVGLSGGAVGVVLFLTAGAGIFAGILPALRGSSIQPARQLREEGRAGSTGKESNRFRSSLVVAQIAMAVTLLIGSGLLLRSLAALQQIEVGFDSENLLTAETRLTAETYQDDEARRIYLEQVVDGLRRMPGTQGASLIAGMPFSGDGSSMPVRPEGSELSWEEAATAFAPVVAEGYFEFMGIPLVAGRTFEPTDGPQNDFVVVISRSLADRYFDGAEAVGRTLEAPEGSGRVIGIVEDTRRWLTTEIEPTLYLHYLQAPPTMFSLLIRTEGRAETYERPMREAFWAVDSNQPLWEVTPLETRMASASSNERFFSVLLGAFAVLALLLAAVGIYGVMAYSVGRRRHELGIRLALGAGRGRILNMVLRQGVVLTSVGALVGVAGAALVGRVLASVLFGVGAFDALTFTVAPALLILVAMVATWLPARRATRVNPVEAFRS